jgi:hypothetical protein
MIKSGVIRLVRKFFLLVILLACFAALNSDIAARKASAQTSCCINCGNLWAECANFCSCCGVPNYSTCMGACFGRYNNCKASCGGC